MRAIRQPGAVLLAATLAAGLLAGSARGAGTPSAPPASASPTTGQALQPAWVFPAAGTIAPVESSPTVFHGVVYAGCDDGRLYAVHATGPDAGMLVPGFPLQLDGAIKGRPAIYGAAGHERVYVATAKGSLYAFHLDGTPAWTRNPQPVSPGVPILSTPAARGNYVYVTASNGRIIRRYVQDGSPAGGLTYGRTVSTRLPSRQTLPPAQSYLTVEDASGFFASGRITIYSRNTVGDLVALDYTYSGKMTAVKPHRLLNVSPVGSGNGLLALPQGSAVVGYGPGASCNSSPAVPGVDDASIVIAAIECEKPDPRYGSRDRNIVGLKSTAYGLVPQWESTYGDRITTAPVVDEKTGSLFVGAWESAGDADRGGRLYSLIASNGQPNAKWPNGGYVPLEGGTLQAGPWLDPANRALYFGSTDGTLYGVRTEDGSPVFAPNRLDNAASSFLASPLLVGENLYIGSHSGRFYAVSVKDPSRFRAYDAPDGRGLDTSPSASGSVPGKDVVVVGSSSGRIIAFPVQ